MWPRNVHSATPTRSALGRPNASCASAGSKPLAATGTAPLAKSSTKTRIPYLRPRTRPTFVAPMLPLPAWKMSTPRARAMRYPNGIAPIRYAATSARTVRNISGGCGRTLRGDRGGALPSRHLFEHSQQLSVMVVERPPSARVRGSGLAGRKPGRIGHVSDHGSQLVCVVRIIHDPTTVRQKQFSRPVVLRGHDWHTTSQGFERDQRAGIVKGGVNEKVGSKVSIPRV